MSGPWEKYQTEESGPWSRYSGRRGGQQPAVTGGQFVDRTNELGRAGVGGLAAVIPGLRQAAGAYEGATGRQVMPDSAPEGLLESGFDFLGKTVPMSLLASGALAHRGAQAAALPIQRGFQGGIDRLAQDTSRFMSQTPVRAGMAEVGGGFGAGVGESLGAQTDLPGARTVGATVGGMSGAMGGAAIPAAVRNARSTISRFSEDLLPTTEWSAHSRAAKQIQRDTADPQGAARLVREAEGPITGAQATGEEGLMARQAAIEREFPATRAAVESGRRRAAESLTSDIRTVQGEPLEPGQWHQRIVQATAPDGAEITRGDPDQMLTQAYKAFDPAYRIVDGQQIPTAGLRERVTGAVSDPTIYGGEEAAPRALRWVNSRLEQLTGDVVDAGQIRRIRTEVRDARRGMTGDNFKSDREVMDAADRALTQHLNDNITDEGLTSSLRQLDHQYRKHMVLTDASAQGDRGATPDSLLNTIRQNLTPGQVARNEPGGLDDLRALGRWGQSARTVMGKPDEARLMVRDLPDADKPMFRAGFVQELMTDARKTNPDEGLDFIDGSSLLAAIRREGPTLDAMGVTATDKARMLDIGKQLMTVQRQSPQATAQIFEDGPSNVLQLVAALSGAKAGQRIAGGGMGSSLVLAQFGSKLMRNALSLAVKDASVDVMVQAAQPTAKGRELYAALLTRPTASVKEQDRAAKIIMGYMYPTAGVAVEEVQENFPR